jgi:hypothetical protein
MWVCECVDKGGGEKKERRKGEPLCVMEVVVRVEGEEEE